MEKKKTSAVIVADSIDERGNRITTYLLTYWRAIHPELLTHRMFSRNAASSRAIPFAKMVKDIQEDPFIPIAWQKDHKGMQGSEYFGGGAPECQREWLVARDTAVHTASILNGGQVTKQLCNRLLEPFQWYTCLVTATEFSNFFELRCPKYKLFGLGGDPQKSRKDWLKHMQFSSSLHPSQYPKTEEEWWSISESSAEIHIQKIAEMMWDSYNESTPKQLKSGEWHIPFSDNIDYALHKWNFLPNITELWGKDMSEYGIKIATARCAIISYETLEDNPKIDYEADIKLHDRLLESKHLSCFEHCARAMNNDEYNTFIKGILSLSEIGTDIAYYEKDRDQTDNLGWCNNFKGFIPYRYLVENK